jgi:hypothetical protein
MRINNEYFPKQHKPVGIYNGDAMCFLSGRGCIFKQYLDEICAARG